MQQEKKYPMLPSNDAVQNWFEENIDKECSASTAIYKFRLWLESLQVAQRSQILQEYKQYKENLKYLGGPDEWTYDKVVLMSKIELFEAFKGFNEVITFLDSTCYAYEEGSLDWEERCLKAESGNVRWIIATERLPLHKAFWNIDDGFKKDCSFPIRIDGIKYGMGDIFSAAQDAKSNFYLSVKGDSTDYYEEDFHRFEWLDEQPVEQKENEAILFAEWLLRENYKPYAGAWYLNGNNFAHQPCFTKELFYEYQKQKEATNG